MSHKFLKKTLDIDTPERELIAPQREPGNQSATEPGDEPSSPDAERGPARREGVVSDPDFRSTADAATTPDVPKPNKAEREPGVGVVSDPDR